MFKSIRVALLRPIGHAHLLTRVSTGLGLRVSREELIAATMALCRRSMWDLRAD